MDETTKIIIATISGFVIAFFAEPVKIYFQNKAKLKNLQIAIYKEIIHNYALLRNFNGEGDFRPLIEFNNEYYIRTECYKQAITSELTLFYQLKEASAINHLYSFLSILSHEKLEQPLGYVIFFMGSLKGRLNNGVFNGKLMKQLAGDETFQQMLNPPKL